MMLVVFNNHDRSRNISIKLDLKKIFGIDGVAEISDLETGKVLASGVNPFTVPVGQRNFRLLHVVIKK